MRGIKAFLISSLAKCEITLIAAVVVALLSPKPSAEVEALYDKAVAYED